MKTRTPLPRSSSLYRNIRYNPTVENNVFDLTDDPNSTKLDSSKKSQLNIRIGESIQCSSEREIFEVLGLPYKLPDERNVFDNAHLFQNIEEINNTVHVDIDSGNTL